MKVAFLQGAAGTSGSSPGVSRRPRAAAARTIEDGWRDSPPIREGALVASTLTRPREGAVIAGVCAGIADRFGWNPLAVRLVFLLSLLLPGPQVIVYLVLWLLMPRRPY
jgi:phage shock protein PspC (stress-responsive transcriptional regulator)